MMTNKNSISVYFPNQWIALAAKKALIAISGSLFLALAAQIALPLPFTAVPITLQTLAVMLLGITMGSRMATCAVITYLAEAAIGFPFLAGGKVLLATTPTIGYLIGFIPQAYLVGLFFERQKAESIFKSFFTLTAISFLQLTMGALWLSLFVGIENAFALGVFPYLLGGAAKIFTVLAILKSKKQLLSF